MSAFGSSTHPSNDTGSPPTNEKPNQRKRPASGYPTPNARSNNGQCPWYYRSPMLNTVYMKPIYTNCHLEGFVTLTATPRFCAAELSTNKSNRAFSLLPIPADESNATSTYCKIEYWESYLYNAEQLGIRWEQLNGGITVRHRPSRWNPLTRHPTTTCPAPYRIVVENNSFLYRRHQDLHQHVPGDFHGYGDFDRSFHDRTWSLRNRPSTIQHSVGATNISAALAVILISILLIITYLLKNIRSWSGNSEEPRIFESGAVRYWTE